MANPNPIRNIRIADDAWFKARESALRKRVTLQDWLTEAIILKLKSDGVEVEHDTDASLKEQG